MNRFEFYYESEIDADANTETLVAILRIDGEMFCDYIHLPELIRSLSGEGEFEIFTCSCGQAPCSGIYPVMVTHKDSSIVWEVADPIAGTGRELPAYTRRFEFERKLVADQVRRASAYVQERIQLSPHTVNGTRLGAQAILEALVGAKRSKPEPSMKHELSSLISSFQNLQSKTTNAIRSKPCPISQFLPKEAKRAIEEGNLGTIASILGRSARTTAAVESPTTRAERARLWKQIRSIEEGDLRDWARRTHRMLDAKALLAEWERQGREEGAEHRVIFNQARQTWIKINEATRFWLHGTWAHYFQRLALHNALFPETAYMFLGFTDVEYPELEATQLAAVVEQPDVQAERGATRQEVEQEMARDGYVRVAGNDYYNPNTGALIQDLHDENALILPTGSLVIIDPIPYIPGPLDFTAGGQLAWQHPPPARPERSRATS